MQCPVLTSSRARAEQGCSELQRQGLAISSLKASLLLDLPGIYFIILLSSCTNRLNTRNSITAEPGALIRPVMAEQLRRSSTEMCHKHWSAGSRAWHQPPCLGRLWCRAAQRHPEPQHIPAQPKCCHCPGPLVVSYLFAASPIEPSARKAWEALSSGGSLLPGASHGSPMPPATGNTTTGMFLF